MSEAASAVRAANPRARLIEIGVADIVRLCRWLGSSGANARFNALMRYVLSESARFCPNEDHDPVVARWAEGFAGGPLHAGETLYDV